MIFVNGFGDGTCVGDECKVGDWVGEDEGEDENNREDIAVGLGGAMAIEVGRGGEL